MPYLLTIAIGPVQDFIASARRSRDLWFGSWLLSELSKAAAQKIVFKYKNESLIFPFVADPSELIPETAFNVVNKILVKIDDNKEAVETLCKDIDHSIKERLKNLARDVFDKMPSKDTHQFHRDVAEEQLKDLVEFYWAAVEMKGDYAKERNHAEGLLSARKATRDFQKVGWHFNENITHAPKSSLDGQRESVIDESVYKNVKDDGWTKDKLYKVFKVRQGERLCGVGLLKRHGEREEKDYAQNKEAFFSTSHVAALPVLESVDAEKYKVAFDRYISKLKTYGFGKQNGLNFVPVHPHTQQHKAFGRYDGHLLFKERLSDYIEDKKNLKDAGNELQKLFRELKVSDPVPYYALLHADGDFMGKAIDAQAQTQDGDDKNTNGITRHKAISEKLSAFAQSVRDIVQVEHKGSLVYSGGDDVLAFVPLHKVLDCAHALSKKFKDELCKFKFKDSEGKEKSPTLSVGVVIAHHLDPLSDTLELARQAEKKAKSVKSKDKSKDALAVTISKRGGVDFTVKGHWEEIDKRLQWFTCLHLDEAIPDGAAYELRELARSFKEMPGEATRLEAMRILKRKRAKDEKIKEDVLKKLEAYIISEDITLEDLANEIIAARTFAKAMKQAGISAEELKKKLEEQEAVTK